ncbi:uncharacterized protein VTP21DRAFT_3519 [Calcarisporiella thermophila]|uniref:uncharacterized protein n=1 Tax=Calcarisporiella thermophila TaxID=911321 RepID=UPI00374231FB
MQSSISSTCLIPYGSEIYKLTPGKQITGLLTNSNLGNITLPTFPDTDGFQCTVATISGKPTVLFVTHFQRFQSGRSHKTVRLNLLDLAQGSLSDLTVELPLARKAYRTRPTLISANDKYIYLSAEYYYIYRIDIAAVQAGAQLTGTLIQELYGASQLISLNNLMWGVSNQLYSRKLIRMQYGDESQYYIDIKSRQRCKSGTNIVGTRIDEKTIYVFTTAGADLTVSSDQAWMPALSVTNNSFPITCSESVGVTAYNGSIYVLIQSPTDNLERLFKRNLTTSGNQEWNQILGAPVPAGDAQFGLTVSSVDDLDDPIYFGPSTGYLIGSGVGIFLGGFILAALITFFIMRRRNRSSAMKAAKTQPPVDTSMPQSEHNV